MSQERNTKSKVPRASKEEEDMGFTPEGGGERRNIPAIRAPAWGQLVLIVAIAVIINLVMSNMMGVSRSDFTNNIQGVAGKVDQVEAKTNEMIGNITGQVNSTLEEQTAQLQVYNNRLNTVESTLKDIANPTDELSSLESQLNDLNLQLDGLEQQLSTVDDFYDERVASLETQVEALEIQLEGTSTGTTSSSEAIDAEIKTYMDVILPAGSDVLTANMKLTITNTLNRPVEDVILSILFSQSGVSPSLTSASITGGVAWSWISGYTGYGLWFNNQWGLDLAAGESKKIMLTLNAAYSSPSAHTVLYQPDITVEDYSLK